MSGNDPPAAQGSRDGENRSNEIRIEERKARALKRTFSKEDKIGNVEPPKVSKAPAENSAKDQNVKDPSTARPKTKRDLKPAKDQKSANSKPITAPASRIPEESTSAKGKRNKSKDNKNPEVNSDCRPSSSRGGPHHSIEFNHEDVISDAESEESFIEEFRPSARSGKATKGLPIKSSKHRTAQAIHYSPDSDYNGDTHPDINMSQMKSLLNSFVNSIKNVQHNNRSRSSSYENHHGHSRRRHSPPRSHAERRYSGRHSRRRRSSSRSSHSRSRSPRRSPSRASSSRRRNNDHTSQVPSDTHRVTTYARRMDHSLPLHSGSHHPSNLYPQQLGEYSRLTQPRTLSAVFGTTKLGKLISKKTLEKIKEDSFVDLNEFANASTSSHSSTAYTLNLQDGDEPAISIQPKRKTQLTEYQWLSAFTEYMSVYTEFWEGATQDMLAYFHMILKMMNKQEDWREYDIVFRKQRDNSPHRWSDVLMDRRLDAANKSRDQAPEKYNKQPFRYSDNPRNLFHSTKPRDGGAHVSRRAGDVSVGYCYDFHEEGSRCDRGANCTYKHVCQICKRPHPLYVHRRMYGHGTQRFNDRSNYRGDRSRDHRERTSNANTTSKTSRPTERPSK